MVGTIDPRPRSPTSHDVCESNIHHRLTLDYPDLRHITSLEHHGSITALLFTHHFNGSPELHPP